MAYFFYLGEVLLPVTPKQLQLTIKNQNKTINLIDEGEVNILKKAGLTEISFKALLPNVRYTFAQYKDGYNAASFYLDRLEKMKTGGQPFQFIVSRTMPNGSVLFNTNIKVSLEDYKIDESADDGFDVTVDIKLKQYRDYGTKTIKIDPPRAASSTNTQAATQAKATATVEKPRESNPAKIGIGSTVIVNGRLHRDSYGQGHRKTLSNYKGKINFVNEKGSHPYHVTNMDGGWLGWVLKSSVQGV